MDDMYPVLEAITPSCQNPMVLATVIKVEGSAYKKAGAAMLLRANQSRVGMLTAGCLEEDLTARAGLVWASGESCTVRYDMRDEDDLSWGQGAGCIGVITLLLEPVIGKTLQHLLTLKNCLDKKQTVTRVKRFTRELVPREEMYVVEDGSVFGDDYPDWNLDDFKETMNNYPFKKGLVSAGNSTDLYFVHPVVPRPHVYVFGAGEDARPLVSLAARVGFGVSVIDWRPGLCARDYFPDAAQLLVEMPAEAIPKLSFTEKDFAVVMTHQYQKDQLILQELQKKKLFYLGVLGPRNRTERLLGMENVPPAIHSPIGLSIGAAGPEEIAVSIVGEMIQRIRKAQA
ncbi:XdhC family protein [Halobacillus rhizosphaerae]|uniref:XdhC family protein n=1 Tax=Halobacillus rhizosphaerae TaxID=3064889 RepID=UPI00398A9ED3